jgi:hypothetical protein
MRSIVKPTEWILWFYAECIIQMVILCLWRSGTPFSSGRIEPLHRQSTPHAPLLTLRAPACTDSTRPLQWIDGTERQGHAIVFVAKFFGRTGLVSFLTAVLEPQRLGRPAATDSTAAVCLHSTAAITSTASGAAICCRGRLHRVSSARCPLLWKRVLQTYVLDVSDVSEVCCRCVYTDVAKVDRDVAMLQWFVHVRCERLFLMFHLFFRRMLQVRLSGCCICFIYML